LRQVESWGTSTTATCEPDRPGNLPLVSVTAVLPTFNRLAALRANLDNVLEMQGVEEVLVVDDGSTDGTHEWLSRLRAPRLRVVRHPGNRGSPAARNTGGAAAGTEWVVFVEDDCRFPREYAQVLRAAARCHEADVVGAPMVHPGPDGDLATALAAARAARTGANGLDGVAGFPELPIRTPLIPAPSLVRRSVLTELWFDTGYTGNAYREETDFFLRAERAGYCCLLTGDTYFWEPARCAGGQPRTLAARWWTVRNNWRFLRRHGDWLVDRGVISSPLREQLVFATRRLLGRA
jgi:GT2 family glycosyltransferase